MSSRTTLESATQDRKARLAQLKSLKRKQAPSTKTAESDTSIPIDAPTYEADESNDSQPPRKRTRSPSPEESVTHTLLSGRNYDPATRGPRLGYETAPNLSSKSGTLEAQAKVIESETRRHREEEEKADKPLDLFKLQPKRPNGDLKRDLERKMEVLNVRTENAIARAVRERVKAAQEAARAKHAKTNGASGSGGGQGEGDAEAIGMEGAALVEATREMEREDAEDEARRRRVDEEEDEARGIGI